MYHLKSSTINLGINYDCDTVIADYRSKASKQEKELFRIDSLHLREDPKKAWALIQPYLNHPGFFELGRWNCCRRVEDKDTIGCQMDVVRRKIENAQECHMVKDYCTWTFCGGGRDANGCEDGALDTSL